MFDVFLVINIKQSITGQSLFKVSIKTYTDDWPHPNFYFLLVQVSTWWCVGCWGWEWGDFSLGFPMQGGELYFTLELHAWMWNY